MSRTKALLRAIGNAGRVLIDEKVGIMAKSIGQYMFQWIMLFRNKSGIVKY